MNGVPTEEEFRAAGMTANAVNFPLSPEGQAIIAEHNGVRVEQLPPSYRYSSNAWMHAWIESLGRAKNLGFIVRNEHGAWLSPYELKAG